MFKKSLNLSIILSFLLTSLSPISSIASAGESLPLPAPGSMVNLSPAYEPVIIKGLTVHKNNPFLFDFIVDVGQDKMSGEPLKKEGEKLIKYFLASLAIPDKDVWVNLSPYEKNRMIPEALGQTDMGRDLLEQDYILKQITASLIYPEKQLGKTFWDKVYAKAQAIYGTTQVPVNTFNKVWILADKAEVFEHNQTAFVVSSHLKVMLEEDYLALKKHGVIASEAKQSFNKIATSPSAPRNDTSTLSSQIVRDIILPALEKEVNIGKNFANLHQIVNSLILANWYKKNLKEALLNQVYTNKSKVNGVIASTAKQSQQRIYEQYLKAYKKGVFNYIKEDVTTQGGSISRKYFSGGFAQGPGFSNPAMTTDSEQVIDSLNSDELVTMYTALDNKPRTIGNFNAAMLAEASERVIGQLEGEYARLGANRNDELVDPIVAIDESGQPIAPMKPDDMVFMVNHRGDRALPLLDALTNPNFNKPGMRFDVQPQEGLVVVPFVAYDARIFRERHLEAAFNSAQPPSETISDQMVSHGVVQGRFAESNKGSHVTFFWDGRRELTKEEYAQQNINLGVVPSESVADEKKKPEMKYAEVAQNAIDFLETHKSKDKVFALVNFATDIQGHVLNGDMERARKTVLATDEALGRLREKVRELGGVLIVTSDHGNIEQMFVLDDNGNFIKDEFGRIPSTQHSITDPVPFIVEGLDGVEFLQKDKSGNELGLANVGPTVLDIMGIPAGVGMAQSLLKRYSPRKTHCPVVLVVRDGWGIDRFNTEDSREGDAVRQANPPVDRDLVEHNPWISIKAHGSAVGLPETQMGDSDNGHTTMGAGKIVPTEFGNIMAQIESGEFYQNRVLRKNIQRAIEEHRDITITGLLSEGGVHSHYMYVMALLQLAAQMGIQHTDVRIKLHVELDGRDVMTRIKEQSGVYYLRKILDEAKRLGLHNVVIGSVDGRKFGMDRDGFNGEKQKGPTETTKRIWNERFLPAYRAKFGLLDAAMTQDDGIPLPPLFVPTVVRGVHLISREDRAREIEKAGYNMFELPSDKVLVDLQTDSGNSSLSIEQRAAMEMADHSYGATPSLQRMKDAVKEVLGFPYVIPVSQGRVASRSLDDVMVKKGQVVVGNRFFATTKAQIQARKAQVLEFYIPQSINPKSLYEFKGNVDIRELRRYVAWAHDSVAYILVTVTDNGGGGQPVSMKNLAAVRAVADEFHLQLWGDVARFAENAMFIKQREPGFENTSIEDIVHQMMRHFDGVQMSAKKNALVHMGGFLALRDQKAYDHLKAEVIRNEGLSGGLGADHMEALAVGIRQGIEESYLEQRLAQVEYLGRKLKEAGIPVVAVGGHAIFIDAKKFLPDVPLEQFPGQALAVELYIEGGIRSVAAGSFAASQQKGADMALLRLTLPWRLLYSAQHLDYVIAKLKRVYERRESIQGFEIVRQPDSLRHFSATFRRVDHAQAARHGIVAQALSPGGIDLNTSNGMQWKVSQGGHGVEMTIDPAMIERIKREGIDSLSPVIFKITRTTSIWPLVGIKDPSLNK